MSAADDRAEERILLPGRQTRLVGHAAAREDNNMWGRALDTVKVWVFGS